MENIHSKMMKLILRRVELKSSSCRITNGTPARWQLGARWLVTVEEKKSSYALKEFDPLIELSPSAECSQLSNEAQLTGFVPHAPQYFPYYYQGTPRCKPHTPIYREGDGTVFNQISPQNTLPSHRPGNSNHPLRAIKTHICSGGVTAWTGGNHKWRKIHPSICVVPSNAVLLRNPFLSPPCVLQPAFAKRGSLRPWIPVESGAPPFQLQRCSRGPLRRSRIRTCPMRSLRSSEPEFEPPSPPPNSLHPAATDDGNGRPRGLGKGGWRGKGVAGNPWLGSWDTPRPV